MKRTLLSCVALLIVTLTQTVRAQSADPIFNGMYSVIGGTADASGEGLVQLIDGDKNTKWCVLGAGDVLHANMPYVYSLSRPSQTMPSLPIMSR